MKVGNQLMLLAGLLPLLKAELYVLDSVGEKQLLNLDTPTKSAGYNQDSTFSQAFHTVDDLESRLQKHGFSMANIHFDQASNPHEVLQLPLEFFSTLMTNDQLIEMILNKKIHKSLFKVESGLCKVHIIKKKGTRQINTIKKGVPKPYVTNLVALRQRLLKLNPVTIRDHTVANKVMKNIPTTAYDVTSPLLALTSSPSSFPCTLRNVARLFNISIRSIIKDYPALLPTVISFLKGIVKLLAIGASIFTIVKTIVEFTTKNIQLLDIIQPKLDLLLTELHSMQKDLNDQVIQLDQATTKHRKSKLAINPPSATTTLSKKELYKKYSNIFSKSRDQHSKRSDQWTSY